MQMKLFLLLSLSAFLSNPTSALCQNAEKQAQEIYYELLSPFCPGRALADCPTDKAVELKEKIKKDLESGKSKEEVIQSILTEYRQNLRAVPNMSGLNALAWILPFVILGAGLVVVIIKIKKHAGADD